LFRHLDQLCDTTDDCPTTPSPNVKLHTPPVPPVLPDTASHEEVKLLFLYSIVIAMTCIVYIQTNQSKKHSYIGL